jgi:hypothetical protein
VVLCDRHRGKKLRRLETSLTISRALRPLACPFTASSCRWLSSLVIVEEQSLATGLLQQGCDLGVLKLDDLLLTLVEDAADGHKQDMPGPEQEGHGYRRKSASFRQRQWKSRGCDGEIRRTLSPVKIGTLSSPEFFDTYGLPH